MFSYCCKLCKKPLPFTGICGECHYEFSQDKIKAVALAEYELLLNQLNDCLDNKLKSKFVILSKKKKKLEDQLLKFKHPEKYSKNTTDKRF